MTQNRLRTGKVSMYTTTLPNRNITPVKCTVYVLLLSVFFSVVLKCALQIPKDPRPVPRGTVDTLL